MVWFQEFLLHQTDDMVLITEYRIPCPYTLADYRLGQRYSNAKTCKESTKGKDGIEILETKPYTDPVTGEEGIYTLKIYHLGGYLSDWVRKLMPESALQLREECWDLPSHVKTVLKNPFMGEKFELKIETRQIENDDGKQENALNITDAKLLSKRKVEVLDIATDELSDKKYVKPEEDPKHFKSTKHELGPLAPGWSNTTKPMTWCYKLVTLKAKIALLQNKAEEYAMGMERDIFLRFHKQMFIWIDEWLGLPLEEIIECEKKFEQEMKERLEKEDETKKGGKKDKKKEEDGKDEV
eukprot:TRINITY_DN12729_c0_g1_i1.p1 TRINITY_DN12729_c0_g1~~TRINITY_DN12729_c0_g1_i1.p1  ORF type:complete len:296 (-),score=83.80 TRINITY_DN12729_c0_g1_i1:192-1079(-)